MTDLGRLLFLFLLEIQWKSTPQAKIAAFRPGSGFVRPTPALDRVCRYRGKAVTGDENLP
jgi:hypothetical protein